jgi:UDP-N-acetylmuramoyl-tripeptide--D-alanyl-D-alanine ligase
MVNIGYNEVFIQSHLIGIYNANNINAAIAIGKYFKIDDIAIKEAINNYIPENNRSQIIQKNGNEIILDAYNANPSSMNAALLNFFQLERNPKIAILGDMFELGDESFEEHQKIVELALNHTEVEVYLIGKHFYRTKKGINNIYFFEDFESFISSLKEKSFTNSLLLIKGSRGMALERTLDFI